MSYVAAIALLEPETRTAASLGGELGWFQFESVRGGKSEITQQNDERPLMTLDGSPQFLLEARKWIDKSSGESQGPFALLLAQYGQFDGVDRMIASLPSMSAADNGGAGANDVLLAGIALSRDSKYIPALKQMAATRQNQWDLRKVLQAMKGMSGPDARQLRLDINKKIRNDTSSASDSD